MKLIHYEKGSKIFLGNNFTSDLDVLLNKAKLQHNKVVLVTGIKSFIKTDFYAKLKNIFRKNQIIIVNHVKIGPNPSESHIMHALSGLDCEFDSVFVVGGGSVVDTGKLIKHRFNSHAKLIVIYTLPGSATIVTPFTVFDNHEFKIGIAMDNLIPNYSYINTQLLGLIDANRKIIAVADIFSHAIESFYSRASTNFSKTKSKQSLKILLNNKIEKLCLNDFIKADILAGLAERVGLILFPHAAGHYLTYKLHIPHSVATMYFLPQYFKLLLSKGVDVDLKYIKYAEDLKALLKNKKLISRINLSKNKITELFNLTHKYMNFAYKNAPVKIGHKEYEIIIKKYV